MKVSAVIMFVALVVQASVYAQPALIDKKATAETKNLFNSLWKLSDKNILFGHQHATEYGHGWSGDADRSDIKSVTGSHPAVIGIDVMGFSGRPEADIAAEKARLKANVIDTYERGGVTTIAWHFFNPISRGGFYWVDSLSKPAVPAIIPGGPAHEQYKEILKGIAEWANSARAKNGKLVPMIFRPYHEFDGGWFWWGKPHCTREEFIALWQFTVTYLRDTLGVHNFIYAFSPDNMFTTEEQFLERYPGDAYVDMVGMDNYADMGRNRYAPELAASKLLIVSDYARKHGKLAAFTETGLESIPNETWWTGTLLKVLKTPGLKLAYVLVWRNDKNSPTHYYAPYPGQVSVPDFLTFYNDPFTLFEKDLKGIYRK